MSAKNIPTYTVLHTVASKALEQEVSHELDKPDLEVDEAKATLRKLLSSTEECGSHCSCKTADKD